MFGFSANRSVDIVLLQAFTATAKWD